MQKHNDLINVFLLILLKPLYYPILCSSSSSAKVGLSSRYCWASDQVVRYVTFAMLSKMFFRASQFLFLSCLACSLSREYNQMVIALDHKAPIPKYDTERGLIPNNYAKHAN